MADSMDPVGTHAGGDAAAAPAATWAADTLDVIWLDPDTQTVQSSLGRYVLEDEGGGGGGVEAPIQDLQIGLSDDRVGLAWAGDGDLAFGAGIGFVGFKVTDLTARRIRRAGP